jgi:hypothetical protein
MDNPVQTLYYLVMGSTGLCNHTNRNCVAVQLETFVYVERVELLRSSGLKGESTPVLRCTCTGLSMLKSYGLEILERIK